MNNDQVSRNQLYIGPGGISLERAAQQLTKVVKSGLAFKFRENFSGPEISFNRDAILHKDLPINGMAIDDILEELEGNILPYVPNFNSLHFMGFPDCGNSLAAVSGAVLADLLNVNLINSTFCSRGATEIEISTIRWLRELVGYPLQTAYSSSSDVGGVVLYGGTQANFTATLLAREKAFPGTLRDGISWDPSKVRLILPDRINHYTMKASLGWLGIGARQIELCPINNFRYDLKALKVLLLRLREQDQVPIMLTAYAGDSRTMTIDRLQELHDVVREIDSKIWLHCDGCHGTSLCFSSELRKNLAGIELWDSVTFDPHKVLNVPYPLSVLLVRDTSAMAAILTESDLIMRQGLSLGQSTPALGSKSFVSLKLWMLLKAHGVKALGQQIEDRIALAKVIQCQLQNHEHFITLNDVSINSVVFIWTPFKTGDEQLLRVKADLSSLNRKIYERILAEGKFYVHSFKTIDNADVLGFGSDFEMDVLRVMVGNPLITSKDIAELLQYIDQIGKEEFLDSPTSSIATTMPG